MELLESKINGLTNSTQVLKHQIAFLRQNEAVQRYIEAFNTYTKEIKELENLKLELDVYRVTHCHHIFVTNSILNEFDGHRTDHTPLCSCIICGLETKIFDADCWEWYQTLATPLEKKLKEVFPYGNVGGTYLDLTCDSKLAMKIYNQIISFYPNSTIEEIIERFKIELSVAITNDDKIKGLTAR